MKFYSLFLALSLILCLGCQSPESRNNLKQKGMFSQAPAKRWEDALISGNGIIGIMVYGDPSNEKTIFNHEFLYEPIGSENVEPPKIAQYLDHTRELMRAGKYEEALKFSYDISVKEGYAGLQWTDPYHPALVMELDQKTGKQIDKYRRSINFESGEVIVEWNSDGKAYKRKSFVSRPDNVIVQLIENGDSDVNCTVSLKMQGEKPAQWDDHRKRPVGFDEPEKFTTKEWLTFRVNYKLNDRGYEVVTKVHCPGAKQTPKGNRLSIEGAEYVLMISRIESLEIFENSNIASTKKVIDQLPLDYEILQKNHAEIHSEIFNRVRFEVYPDSLTRHSSEELIALQKESPEIIVPELLESMVNMGRYTLISSSGNNPPNLMGIWNGKWRPAWSGDFTTDANINLQISSANICNLPEAIDSYMRMLERIAPDWEINAKNLYGCRGYLAGPRTSGRRGLHTHFSIGFPGHFWLAGAAWLLSPCYEYYQVSGDEEFLTERLLPMMEKTVLFFEDFLTEYDENGDFIFVPSYSPENRPSNISVSASMNATMDIASAKEVFTNLIAIYEELGIKPEKKEDLKEKLKKFPPYLVNSDGALKEWAIEGLEDNYNHRHISHLYPVWPGHEINPEDTPELFEAAVAATQKRLTGDESAHGLTYRALIGARLKHPELLYENLHFMLSADFIYTGLFTSHNPNLRIFNSDALCSFPAVIAEALVYSRPGFIELMPAWSTKFPDGSITNLKCRTKAVIEELNWNNSKGEINFSIRSLTGQNIMFMVRNEDMTIVDHEETINLDLKKGVPILISFKAGETKEFKLMIIDN